ncbi:hypothetical protein EON64_18645, partial [archaeon]
MSIEPASHSYLGYQLSHVSPSLRGLLTPGELYNLILVPLQDVVLFPGETLPLRVRQQEYIRRLSSVLGREDTHTPELIGVTHILSRLARRPSRLPTTHHDLDTILSRLNKIGTTIEIRTAHRTEEDNFEELLCTSRGRQRFFIESLAQSGRIFTARVRILHDLLPSPCAYPICTHPLPGFLLELASCRQIAILAYELALDILFGSSRETNSCTSSSNRGGRETRTSVPAAWRRWGCVADVTTISPSTSLSSGAKDTLAAADPVSLSFFLAANLPLSPTTLLSLLSAQTVFERLSLLVRILRKMHAQSSVLGCAACLSPLATISDCFQFPGAEGLAGAYVNSGGYVHPTCTFRRLLRNARCVTSGAPSLQDTWFHSYAWQVALCGGCGEHVGWRYIQVGGEG